MPATPPWSVLAAAFCSFLVLSSSAQSGRDATWPAYGGTNAGQRFSEAKQITPENVGKLKKAWEFHTGALDSQRMGYKMASFEATPVLFQNELIFTSPYAEVYAVDAETGKKLWSHDPQVVPFGPSHITTSRGVAVWQGPATEKGLCRDRVFAGTIDGRLFAVDATTGAACTDFGDKGEINLKNAEVEYKKHDVYAVTSAPTVVGDVVVTGSSLPDNQWVDIERGNVRAFDVRTGKQLWSFNPIPWADQQKLRTGAGNAWSTISADEALGLVYIPTGSPSPDYYGGMRPGNNADADAVVALDARTGKKVWSFQLVHHDLWDFDTAAQPLLFTLHGKTPALAITNKTGMVYVLDRRNGQPLYPIEERPVPQSDVPGEQAAPTQPFSSLPSLSPATVFESQNISPEWQRDPAQVQECSTKLASLRWEGIFTPPSLRGTLEFPGKVGGVNWGSLAFDPSTGIVYADTNRAPFEIGLRQHPQETWFDRKFERVKVRISRLGANRYRLTFVTLGLVLIGALISRGFHSGTPVVLGVIAAVLFVASVYKIRDLHRKALEAYVSQEKEGTLGIDDSPQTGTPYSIYLRPVNDSLGHPCNRQPWATVSALNLETGKMAWQAALGTEIPGQQTGSFELGGPIVTAGGVVFSAATRSPYLYGFDKSTGKNIWTEELPVPAIATPMTYSLHGRQYVVIAAGGSGLIRTATGDSVIAYALP